MPESKDGVRAIDYIDVDGLTIPGDMIKPLGRYDLNIEKGELEITLIVGSEVKIAYSEGPLE